MHVIKESYETITRRQMLKSQKQNILDMEFSAGLSKGWNDLNRFVSERASERISHLDIQIKSPVHKQN